MKIAVCSDEPYAVHETILAELAARGHEVVRFGSLATGEDAPWALVAEEAALAVTHGDCDEGIFLCWTGTGISIAANKVRGVRAALCSDAETARGARQWNDANVLALSQRLLTEALADEILQAWFDAAPSEDSQDVTCLRALDELDGAR